MDNNPTQTSQVEIIMKPLEYYLDQCVIVKNQLDSYMQRYNFGSYYVDRSGLKVCVDYIESTTLYQELYCNIKIRADWRVDINDFISFVNYYFTTEYCEKLYNHMKEWNEEKYNTGKKLYNYFIEANIGHLDGSWYGSSPHLNKFKNYYENNPTFKKTEVIDYESYYTVYNSDVAIRFLNAINQESKYTPGQFVLVKLGKMPQRIINTMPEQNQNYINKKKNADDLVSAGIILDVITNKEIKVKNKGSWYKVAIATPFSIFCLEERHLKKFNPTKEYVEKLIVSYNEAEK